MNIFKAIFLTLFPDSKPVSEHIETSDMAEQNSLGNEFNTELGASLGIYGSDRVPPPYAIEDIQRFVRSPQLYNAELRRLAWWMYYSNGTVSTAVDYLRSIYTLDFVISSKNKLKNTNNPNKSLQHKNKMSQILNLIRYKQVIRDALLHDANDGMYIAYFDSSTHSEIDYKNLSDADIFGITELNEQLNAMITPLPIDRCRLVGRCNNSYVVAFDLNYFREFKESERKAKLKQFPKEISDGYIKYDTGNQSKQWLVLNYHKTIVTKIKSEITDPYGIPFAVAALNNAEYAQYFINTKRHVLDSLNNQIVYETFPEGQTKGSSSLTDKQQTQQHNTVKSALMSRNSINGISFFSLASGTKMDTIKTDTDLLDEKNESAIVDSVNKSIGFSAAALDGSNTGTYATATTNLELVSANVYTWIEDIVNELNKCINYSIISDPSCAVEFYILPTTFVNRDKQVKYMKELYTSGKGSLTAWIASTGFNPEIYLDLMNQEIEDDLENKYPVHKTSFTITGKDAVDSDADKSGGRPVDDTSTNPNTEKTKNNNGNAAPAPSA